MKSSLIVLALVMLATSYNLGILNAAVGTFKETEGVLKCISDKDLKLNINNITNFCGSDFYANKSGCFSAYSSFKLCLINNNCQSKLTDVQIALPCWNCWADMLATSDELKEYQNKIRICASHERYITILLSILVFLLVVLF